MKEEIESTLAILLTATLLILSAAPVLAQTSKGTVTGVVTDTQGAVIPGAVAELTNNAPIRLDRLPQTIRVSIVWVESWPVAI